LDALARATHSHSACIWSSRRAGRPAYLGNKTFSNEGVAKINRPGDPPYTDEILISSRSDDGFVPMLAHRARSRIERLPFYQDVLTKIDFAHFSGYSMDPDDGSLLKVAFWRSFGEGAFLDDHLSAMNSVLSNIRYAILFALQKNAILSERAATPFIDRGEATFAIHDGGLVKPISGSAEISMTGMPLSVLRGRFAAAFEDETKRIDRVIGEALGPDRTPGSTVITSEAGDRYQLLAIPVRGEALDVFGAVRAIATLIRLGSVPADFVDDRIVRILKTGFELTVREAEVAALMAGGCAPTAISARLRIGEGTVRNHVKAVFRKVGVRSQVELAALVARYR
jgi:DNA-binding CsgD family transcriptional regulator